MLSIFCELSIFCQALLSACLTLSLLVVQQHAIGRYKYLKMVVTGPQ